MIVVFIFIIVSAITALVYASILTPGYVDSIKGQIMQIENGTRTEVNSLYIGMLILSIFLLVMMPIVIISAIICLIYHVKNYKLIQQHETDTQALKEFKETKRELKRHEKITQLEKQLEELKKDE